MTLGLPKRLTGQSRSHGRSKTQEKQTAARLGTKPVHRSGAGFEKGDVRVRGFVRIEAKTTQNKSFPITAELIDKIEAAAFGTKEIPIIQIEILGGAKKALVLPDWALDDILEALKGGQG